MVLDILIGLIALVGTLVLIAVQLVLNLCLLVAEGIVRLVCPEKKLRRMRLARWGRGGDGPAEREPVPALVTGAAVLIIVGCSLGPRLFDSFRMRSVEVIAEDGLPVPLALFEVRSRSVTEKVRTDFAGKLDVPRFGLARVTVVDPRYREREWPGSALGGRVVVERTLLGRSFDYLLERVGE